MRYDISKHNLERMACLPERDIANLYAGGMTVSEIAARFTVSVQPIKRILQAMGVQMRQAARRPGTSSGSDNPAWRGGRRVRADGYVVVWTPEGEQLEHRVVMARALGRLLLPSEVVHHKDKNRSNNDLSNLELVASQEQHALRHGEQNRRTLLDHGIKECTVCHLVKPISEFYKTKYNRMGIQSWCKNCKNQRDSARRMKGRSSSRGQ